MKGVSSFLIRTGLKILMGSACVLMLYSCSGDKPGQKESKGLTGTLIIFHAGSLSVPMHQLADSFRVRHPGVDIQMEAAGSKACARKITDLNKACDVFASSDYKVIENMLMPDHAQWCIRFASNEMALVYTDKSKYSQQLTAQNWPEILLKKDVAYGRSDPDSDPCGVRAVMTMQLSEKYYKKNALTGSLLAKNREMIRPKETDLLALLETGSVDYLFLYRSVAQQHGLKYLVLPDSVNMKNPGLADFYRSASLEVRGKTPEERTIEYGEPMVYGITIPLNAPNPSLAEAFLQYFLSEGMKIMEANGQPSVIPSYAEGYDQLPVSLKNFASGK